MPLMSSRSSSNSRNKKHKKLKLLNFDCFQKKNDEANFISNLRREYKEQLKFKNLTNQKNKTKLLDNLRNSHNGSKIKKMNVTFDFNGNEIPINKISGNRDYKHNSSK